MRVNKKPTKGHIRMRNYFAEILHTDSFKTAIRDIRLKYDIPIEGFNPDNILSKSNSEVRLMTPPEWSCRPNFTILNKQLSKDITTLCEHNELYGEQWHDAVYEHIFWNTELYLNETWPDYDVCFLGDTNNQSYKKMYPIVIRVSQYAPISNIVEFIERNKKEILELQEPLRKKNVSLAGVRTKKLSLKDRDDFIYEHRNLTTKKIGSLLMKEKGIDMDYGAIGKIISIQKKRREK